MASFDREAVRRRLLDRQEELRRTISIIVNRSFDKGGRSSVQELSSYDNHPADLGTETFEREKDLGLIGNERVFLDRVRRALEKLDEDSYGRCDVCGDPIDEERLEAMPEATRCTRCQAATEGLPDRHPRPIEEEVLYPPFGRSWTGDRGGVGFDGEDAWQAVARYGTASDRGGGEGPRGDGDGVNDPQGKAGLHGREETPGRED